MNLQYILKYNEKKEKKQIYRYKFNNTYGQLKKKININ